MEPVLHLHADLARVGKVCASEGVAVIEEIVVIAEIHPSDADVPVLSEGLAQSQIVSSVCWEVRRSLAIEETGAVVYAEVHPGSPRQSQIESGCERIALVVVQKAQRVLAEAARVQSAGDDAVPLRVLVGVG